jgi:DNA-binding LytR/AlgR family response regulator
MIRCLVIDDEPLAQNVIETFIQRVSFLTMAGKCENAVDAYDIMQHTPVDLIFCDIQMPQITGLEFIRSLKNPPPVIFTSAFAEYAIEGFDVDAVDYLLKPIAFERFLKSVQKVKQLLGSDQPSGKTESPADYLFVKEDYRLVKINHSDIFFIQGMKDYVKIFTNQKTIITHITMKRLEELLPGNSFHRTHKSFIIRFDAVKAINGNEIEMINNLKVPIGLQYRDNLMSLFKSSN